MKVISAKQLERAGACEDQVRLFRRTFGDGLIRLAPKNWGRAGLIGLNRAWLWRFLKEPALVEYKKAQNRAKCEYEMARNAAWNEYKLACGPAFADTSPQAGAVHAAAWALYRKVQKVLLAEYEKTCDALLFAALLNSESRY